MTFLNASGSELREATPPSHRITRPPPSAAGCIWWWWQSLIKPLLCLQFQIIRTHNTTTMVYPSERRLKVDITAWVYLRLTTVPVPVSSLIPEPVLHQVQVQVQIPTHTSQFCREDHSRRHPGRVQTSLVSGRSASFSKRQHEYHDFPVPESDRVPDLVPDHVVPGKA